MVSLDGCHHQDSKTGERGAHAGDDVQSASVRRVAACAQDAQRASRVCGCERAAGVHCCVAKILPNLSAVLQRGAATHRPDEVHHRPSGRDSHVGCKATRRGEGGAQQLYPGRQRHLCARLVAHAVHILPQDHAAVAGLHDGPHCGWAHSPIGAGHAHRRARLARLQRERH